jgi:hypothetical protein
MKRISDSSSANMLKDIHSKLTEFPNEFRNKVGQECLWSVPTYYRKMKSLTDTDTSPLSNAEKDKILTILNESLTELIVYFKKYRKPQ